MNGYDPNFEVKAGDPLSAKPWNAARRLFSSLRILAGRNVRLRIIPNQGTVINFDGDSASFVGPLNVTLNGSVGASITPGFINQVMPNIQDSGAGGSGNAAALDDDPAPSLIWSKPVLDTNGRGYIAAECNLNAVVDPDTGAAAMSEVQSVNIVQVADLNTNDGTSDPNNPSTPNALGGVLAISKARVRWPLAMIRLRADGSLSCIQNSYHNLQMRAGVAASGSVLAPVRYFFYPAG